MFLQHTRSLVTSPSVSVSVTIGRGFFGRPYLVGRPRNARYCSSASTVLSLWWYEYPDVYNFSTNRSALSSLGRCPISRVIRFIALAYPLAVTGCNPLRAIKNRTNVFSFSILYIVQYLKT